MRPKITSGPGALPGFILAIAASSSSIKNGIERFAAALICEAKDCSLSSRVCTIHGKKGAIASRRLDFYLLVHGRYFISLLPTIGNQWRRSPIRNLGTRPLGVTGSPEGEAWRVVGRLEGGQTQAEVAQAIEVSQSVISRIWNRFFETGSASRRPGQGRRRATTRNEDRYLVLTAQIHQNMNATLLQQHLSSATGTTVSTQTVRNRFHGVGMYARRPMVCVRLTSRHRCDRREWATEHVNWRRNEWSNVLFSDESRFSVHPDNRRIFIWRDRGSRNKILRLRTKVSDLAVEECWCMVASPLTDAQTSTSFEMDL
ncbi:transposable element Tcb2 transposase [Trichonephila clavipes]|nr:transposable element Tcb2 transposase [Trichonephila clavipes]